MNKPEAFRASYSDLKLIKTRQCVQIVFELPLADFDAAYDVLGGLPDNAKETWFAIAPLGKEVVPNPLPGQHNARPLPEPNLAGAKREWRDVKPSQQAGIRCNEALFWTFLQEEYQHRVASNEDAATAVRKICGVNSRAHFNTNHQARMLWFQLDNQFQAWQLKEKVGI